MATNATDPTRPTSGASATVHALTASGPLRAQAHTRLVRHTLRATPRLVSTIPAARAVTRLDAPRGPDQGPLAGLEHFGPARWMSPSTGAITRAHDALPILLRHLCGAPSAPYRPHEITVVTSTAAPELSVETLYGAALQSIEGWPTLYPLMLEADAWALREDLGLWSPTPWGHGATATHPLFAVRGATPSAAWLEIPATPPGGAPLPFAFEADRCQTLRQSLVMTEDEYLRTAHADDLLVSVLCVPDLVWVVRAHAPLRDTERAVGRPRRRS